MPDNEEEQEAVNSAQTTLIKLQKKDSWRVLTACSGDASVKTVPPDDFNNTWERWLVKYLDDARAVLNARGILWNKKIDLCIDSSMPGLNPAYFSKSDNKIHFKGPGIMKLHLYHEIGHWAMSNYGGFAAASKSWSVCGAVSAWGTATTPLCAFLEGWADFFATELSGQSQVLDVDYSKAPPKTGDKWKGSVAKYLYELRKSQSLDFIIDSAKPATSLTTINPFWCSEDPYTSCGPVNSAKLLVGAIKASDSCDCTALRRLQCPASRECNPFLPLPNRSHQ